MLKNYSTLPAWLDSFYLVILGASALNEFSHQQDPDDLFLRQSAFKTSRLFIRCPVQSGSLHAW